MSAQEQSITIFLIDENEKQLVVNSINQDETGYLWLATNVGLYQYDGVSFTKKIDEHFKTITSKKDTLFLTNHKGLSIYENEKITTLEEKTTQKVITIDDTVYLATSKGVSVYKNGDFRPLSIHKTIDTAVVNDLLKVGDCIHLATNKGLWSLQHTGNFKNIQQLQAGKIAQLLEHRKHILATTTKGFLDIYSNDKILKTLRFKTKINAVFKVDNEIWVLLNKSGIEVYDANNYTFIRKINKYNSSISDNVTTMYVDKYNTIWLGTKNDGLYKISNNTQKIIEQPNLSLKAVTVNFNAVSFRAKEKIILNANENNIAFSFTTVSLENPNEIAYRYKLKGKFSDWSKQDFANFSDLQPGNYRFCVQSKIENRYSTKMCIPFFIDIPFYEKAWFYIAIATTFFLVLFLIMEIRFRKSKRKNLQKINRLELKNHLITLEQKALQTQMNPHFIFNILNGIKAYGNDGKITKMNETISEFSILLRSILSNSRASEITLQEEINTIKNYITLAQKINPKTFAYNIKTVLNDISSDEILIPPMLIQPFIENSIEHGFKPHKKDNFITIIFEVKQAFLHCSIIDNGVGYQQSKKEKQTNNHKSMALKITKERIVNLCFKNCFSIEQIEKNDEIYGTKVWFKIPLKTDY